MEKIQLTKIIKVGNSLGVIIPKNILTALNIQRDDQIAFGIYADDVICIHKVSYEDLLKLKPR